MAQLINAGPKHGTFVRVDGHHIQMGHVVAYRLQGMNFAVLANRDGVEVMGSFPRVDRRGIAALQDILNRAVRHHEHLAKFKIGEKQTTIPDIVFEEEEAQRDARLSAERPPSGVVM